ncbi:MAG: HAD family hydrolase [Blastocatellia bacterium]
MREKRAVIWDLDGTIIDSESHHWEAWKVLMAAENFSITYEEYVADFGRRNDEILRLRMSPDLAESEIARLSWSKEEAYRQLVRTKGIGLLPGVEEWFANLRADGWLQALGTSAPRANVEAIFAVHPIRRYFDAVMSADQVAHGKPHPDVFLAAAREAGVSPSQCLVIEDAPAGIEAARRAGMRSLAVQTTHRALEGDWTVATLDRLPRDFFNRIFSE